MRHYITNVGLIIGSLFWSAFVNSINNLAVSFHLPLYLQSYFSVCILLGFLLFLPFIFDVLARNYECIKLESEIQNSIMTRYFYYQLVNIYVTVALSNLDIKEQLLDMIRDPRTFVVILGSTIPSVSVYFADLLIVKIFVAIPGEMLRPWQLATILSISYGMDRRKCTRRELRTGAFYSWPMLYGWVYPQLMIVEMIVLTYSVISPLLMPFAIVFYVFAYAMYKYQLLYVYVNEYQSGGFMFYAVFNRSMIALVFASIVMLAYFSVDLASSYHYGPFLFLLPLPVGIVYFWHYCDSLFKKKMVRSFI
jgi:hypothetical protein